MFLMLAHTAKTIPTGWLCSEKLDGMRAWYDGGVSRGHLKGDIPWANRKDEGKLDHQCTGLWSRYNNVIHAPQEWLNELPRLVFDGELYIPPTKGVSHRQDLMSIVKRYEPDPDHWRHVRHCVFDMPPIDRCFADREIKFGKDDRYDMVDAMKWFPEGALDLITPDLHFEYIYKIMNNRLSGHPILKVLKQSVVRDVPAKLAEITDAGGEGLMLRDPYSFWEPKRSHNLLKVKRLQDAEGEIIGFTEGKGRHVGRVGALVIKWTYDEYVDNPGPLPSGVLPLRQAPMRTVTKIFNLSGMTDPEREYGHFKIGQFVTFHFRDTTKEGMPQEARFWRIKESE